MMKFKYSYCLIANGIYQRENKTEMKRVMHFKVCKYKAQQ